MQLLG